MYYNIQNVATHARENSLSCSLRGQKPRIASRCGHGVPISIPSPLLHFTKVPQLLFRHFHCCRWFRQLRLFPPRQGCTRKRGLPPFHAPPAHGGESSESTPERVQLHWDGGRPRAEIRKQQGRSESFHLSGGEERSPPANFLGLPDKLAEISLKHLKPNDFIYVSGLLGSYEKLNASGQHEIFYKVAVQDLNYVRQFDQRRPTLKNVTPGSEELFASPSGPVGEEMPGASGPKPEEQHLDRLHLWHLFFASPNEWWDNRRHKHNTRLPDFKHKDTKECLWLTPDDPPWVRRQLELYDSNMEGVLQRDASHWLGPHKWKSKDF